MSCFAIDLQLLCRKIVDAEMIFHTPRQLSPTILKFVERIVPCGIPEFVPVQPMAGGEENECFANVAAKIKLEEGCVQHGWAIWEWPHTILEAEFHAVWRHSTNASLLDVTPRADDETQVLFIPDSTREYSGNSIDNFRIPLREDPRIREFIGLAKRRFSLLNNGTPAHASGYVSVPAGEFAPIELRLYELQQELSRKIPGRNDPCPCGSEKKFKNCHGL